MIERLRRKKVVQWSLAYLAGGWLVFQVLDVVAEPWDMSSALVRGAQFVLTVGFLAAVVIAWFHGERGRQRVGGVEALLLAGLGVVAIAGLSVVTRSGPDTETTGRLLAAEPYFPLERDRPAIAVLPLTSPGASPDDAYFAEGIHEELINRLTRISSLIVIARTSVMRFADGQTSAREIGQQLGTGFVLEGSARRVESRVRVTAQLVEAATEQPVWAETYDLELTVDNLFDIQIDVAERLAAALQLELTPSDRLGIEDRPTGNLQAYESYLLGRVAWARRTPESHQEAVSHLTRATELDPTFAKAYSALAEAYVLQPWFSTAYQTDAALARTEEVARRALALDPSLGEAHTALGLVREFQYDWAGAEEEFLRAIEKTPEYSTAHHWFANMLSRRGRSEEGLAHIRRAYELDPLSLIINQDVGFNLNLAGERTAALNQFGRVLQLDPDYPTTTMVYARALLAEERFDEAKKYFERWATLTGNNPAALGRLADAFRARFETGREQPLPDGVQIEGTFPPYALTMTYMALGQHERALETLESAFAEGQFGVTLGLRSGFYDPIREDPRFIAIAEVVGLGLPEGH